MSSLWTPSGEHTPKNDPPASASAGGIPEGDSSPIAPPPGADQPSDANAADMEEMRRQLASAPADVVIANHCYGLFELAAIYLSQSPPMLGEAQLAIDGLGALVEGLEGRLGEAEPALIDAVSQVRLAFVQLRAVEQAAAQEAEASAVDPSTN